MLIAVASSDGRKVDTHFGKANRFLIYNKTSSGLELLGEQRVTPYSTGSMSHDFDQERFDQVYAAVKSCQRIYVCKIGDRPERELVKRGIEAIIYEGPILKIS